MSAVQKAIRTGRITTTADGKIDPAQADADRQRADLGGVVDRAGPWRASGDWWDGAYSREEWDVTLGGAGLYRIFRDRLRDAWFVEGELD